MKNSWNTAGMLAELVGEIATISHELAKARASGHEGLRTGLPFLDAARAALNPLHNFPNADLTIDLRESRYVDFLRRHHFNAWMHSLETSSWTWLFGMIRSRPAPPNVPPPSFELLKELAPLSDRDSRIGYLYRKAELLFRAAGGEPLVTSDALHVAAMLRAGGSFEYLGDHLLLAWRIAGSEGERRGIAWFLQQQVPKIGFNGLPKLALDYLVNQDLTGEPDTHSDRLASGSK